MGKTKRGNGSSSYLNQEAVGFHQQPLSIGGGCVVLCKQQQYRRRMADSVCESALKLVAKHHFFQARQATTDTLSSDVPGKDNYLQAIRAYEKFLDVYPDNPNRARLGYQLAEAYYAIRDYDTAARKYMKVSQLPDKEVSMMAAYNAIVAAQELLKKADETNKKN